MKRDSGYYIEPDPLQSAVLCEIPRQLIASASYVQVARWANECGYPTQLGGLWRSANLQALLSRKPAQELVEDPAALRRAMRDRQQNRGKWTSGRHSLLRVAYYAKCHAPLYGTLRRDKAPVYRCIGCRFSIRKAVAETTVERLIMQTAGDRLLTRRVLIPGDDHSKQIARLETQLETAQGLEFVDTSGLETGIARLRDLPHEADKWEEVPVEPRRTVREHWESLDSAGRGAFLRTWGVRADCNREGIRLVTGWLEVDSDTFRQQPAPVEVDRETMLRMLRMKS